jgi:triosephosphate isomerase (TIM)
LPKTTVSPGGALIAGNWKMHKLSSEAVETLRQLQSCLAEAGPLPAGDVLICPPFTALWALRASLDPSGPLGLAAQDVHWQDQGAYTGEVSAPMLVDAGCRAVLIGHSERRAQAGETDSQVAAKTNAALDAGLMPIICVGETLEQRQAGETDLTLKAQVKAVVDGLADQHRSAELVLAYEPVWAIGTGQAAVGADALAAAATIRATLPPQLAAKARVLYGGSVKATNVAEFMRHPQIAGVLVGGASLEGREFGRLVISGLKAKSR